MNGQSNKNTPTEALISLSLLAKLSEYQLVTSAPAMNARAAKRAAPPTTNRARFMSKPKTVLVEYFPDSRVFWGGAV